MTITTILGGGIMFFAGMCAGVFLNENEVVTADHLSDGAAKVKQCVKSMTTGKCAGGPDKEREVQ
jgi:hypothetical protein